MMDKCGILAFVELVLNGIEGTSPKNFKCILNSKTCAVSLSYTKDKDKLWVAAQFISI